MAYKINDKVTWVGKIDWELRRFHGDELSTHRGSSYNSYLIKDEKNVLIDTVWEPYDKDFIKKLKQEIKLEDIDYIIMQHNEIDHSGALPLLMKEIPNTPIYCTKNGEKIIRAHFHEDWNFVNVKTGDTLNIGKSNLTFIEARMIHWPDSMMTYMDEGEILFSNDAFGQHYSSDLMFDDLVNQCELYEEALKYYANIVAPFSPLVKMKLNEIKKMNLDIKMIATSHGIIWRKDTEKIMNLYYEWADNYEENQITIFYDTMWDATKRMAEAIRDGIKLENPNISVKLYNSAHSDKNDIITEIFKSKAVLVGSSTVNNSIMSATSGILDMLRGMGFKKKKASAFGSYGWSGESVKILLERLKAAKFDIVDEGIRILWNPDEKDIETCIEYGNNFAKNIK